MLLRVLLSIILIAVTYFLRSLYQYYKVAKKLNWLPDSPGLPIIGAVLEFGDNTQVINDFDRLIKQHGKIVYINLFLYPSIIATDYNFVEHILSKQDVLNKSSDYDFFHRWLGTGLLTSSGTKWKKRRRMVTPAFHFSILEQFIEVFQQNLDILISELDKEVDKDSIDIYPFINLFALDVICESTMGVSVNAQVDKKSSYVRNVKEMCRICIERSFSLIKHSSVAYVFFPDFYKELKIVKALHAVTNSVIYARRKELENKSDINDEKDDVYRKKKMAFLDILLQSTIDGQPLSNEDIREEVDTFMFEGHDTVSSAISFSLYLLAMNPKVQERALEEQKVILEGNMNRRTTYNDLKYMKYLEMVIKETLRLYPSVPMMGRLTDQEVQYKGNTIPKGVNIGIFTYGILRDPEFFDQPDKFNPDRFENNEGTKPYSYIPFSAGPRNCIGQKFAMLELKSTLSKILTTFEILPPTPEHKMILVSEAVLKSKNGVRIKLRKRKW